MLVLLPDRESYPGFGSTQNVEKQDRETDVDRSLIANLKPICPSNNAGHNAGEMRVERLARMTMCE
jgi:hypothetical protein